MPTLTPVWTSVNLSPQPFHSLRVTPQPHRIAHLFRAMTRNLYVGPDLFLNIEFLLQLLDVLRLVMKMSQKIPWSVWS